MSSARDEVREILLDTADNVRREPDLMTRVGMADEFIAVALRTAMDLRDATCYDLMTAKVSKHNQQGLPAWCSRRWQYASRWAVAKGLPTPWKERVGRPKMEGPDQYLELRLPE